MKTYLTFIAIAIVTATLAQTKPKPKTNEPMPTQKELEALMKQAQQELNNLDPETKRMMDSMGIQLPSFNSMPDVTNAQLQQAYDNENRIVPLKDVARIASILKVALTTATMPSYLTTTHRSVSGKLRSASVAKGDELYQMLKEQYNATTIGNAAGSLLMLGKAELALYVMGKACLDDPSNTNNLNNYASMLTMGGAEQLALPLLNFVNKQHPNNSTVLNNIGQAWFGLGDIEQASHHLDAALRIFALHAQANYTKSFIEESRNNKTAAIEAMKRSIKASYSPAKESRLKDLGYTLSPDDVQWNHRMPQDPLGLEKFSWPAYPTTVAESEVLEKEWRVFKDACQQALEILRPQLDKRQQEMVQAMQQRNTKLMQAAQKGSMSNFMPPFAEKATIKLRYLIDGKDGQRIYGLQTKQQALITASLKADELQRKNAGEVNQVDKKYESRFGEGKENPFEAACTDENAVNDKYLSTTNKMLEETSRDYLNLLRRKLNDEVYYYQYTQWPEEFEMMKLNAKVTWLSSIQSQKVIFKNKSKWCQPSPAKPAKPFTLAAFDDIHCQYHSELVTPVGTIRTDCSRITTTLDLKVVKLGLKQDMDRETFGDQFMMCTVEVGVATGAGFNAGPLKAEASIGAGVAASFDRNGLTDLVLKSSAGVSVGSDVIQDGSTAGVGVSDLSLDVGVQGQISLISGRSSVESTGLLGGVFEK